MRSINLLSLTVLAGVVIGIRCLVIPAAESLPRPERVHLMGKLMPAARRLLLLGLLFFIGSSFWQMIVADISSPTGAMEVVTRVATMLVIVVLAPLTLSPHRLVSLRVEHHRRMLLTIALVLLVVLLVLAA
jgi:hypothetical protein